MTFNAHRTFRFGFQTARPRSSCPVRRTIASGSSRGRGGEIIGIEQPEAAKGRLEGAVAEIERMVADARGDTVTYVAAGLLYTARGVGCGERSVWDLHTVRKPLYLWSWRRINRWT